jgi:hypothetical protein
MNISDEAVIHLLANISAWVLLGSLIWVLGDSFSPRPGKKHK